jgi:hypothetical protein
MPGMKIFASRHKSVLRLENIALLSLEPTVQGVKTASPVAPERTKPRFINQRRIVQPENFYLKLFDELI